MTNRYLALHAATAFVALALGSFVVAQQLANGTPTASLIPLISSPANVAPTAASNFMAPAGVPGRGPLAQLIKNPNETSGAPPFALTDRSGTVQRYVESVPGIELEPYVGQVVAVRHDTGETLLASQLELPPSQFLPMLNAVSSSTANIASKPANRPPQKSQPIQQAQYVDNDDTSVQLLPEDVELPSGKAMIAGGPEMAGEMAPGEVYPESPGIMSPIEANGAWADPSSAYEAMQYGPAMPGMYPSAMQYGPGPPMYADPMMEAQPCPSCGRFHPAGPACPGMARRMQHGDRPSDQAQFFADVEFNFLRPQIADTVVGPLSESLQFSPRIVAGVSGLGNFDGRIRYWHYGQDTDVIGPGAGDIRLQFNVVDVEAIHRFCGRRSQAILAAGVRFAGIDLTDNEDQKIGTDLFGLTFAADGYTPLRVLPDGEFGWVYGGRLSILRGNWGGDRSNDFISAPVDGDNVVANELYVGLQLAKRCRNMNVYGRAAFEMQNWRSDVFAPSADIESIGFLGPGLSFGADF